eukprot:2870538-Pleurochrysis_carterae.AAC.1
MASSSATSSTTSSFALPGATGAATSTAGRSLRCCLRTLLPIALHFVTIPVLCTFSGVEGWNGPVQR